MVIMNKLPRTTQRTPPSCFSCQWRERSQWCVLDQEDFRILAKNKTCSTYAPGQLIFQQGAPTTGIYCIEQGVVALRRSDAHGHSVLVRLCHGGETIGYRDVLAGGEYGTSAECLHESRICLISQASVQGLLERNPALGLSFLKRSLSDLQQAEETILQITSLSVRGRLAHLLLALKDRYGEASETGRLSIDLPLSRQDIASILGTRPETVARAIHALEVDGVVVFSGRRATVPDLDGLLDELEPTS